MLLYQSNEILLTGEKQASIRYSIPSDADRAKLLIYNDHGDLVFTDEIDSAAGDYAYDWDGEDFPAGEYQFVVDAIVAGENGDERLNISNTTTGRVTGVETDGGVVYLQIGPATVIPLGNIEAVSVPEDTEEGKHMSLFSSLYVGANGMHAQSRSTEIISNNIANMSTVGYKRKSDTAFKEILGDADLGRGTLHGVGNVMATEVARIREQGAIQQTYSDTDLAITGNGMFTVSATAEGTQSSSTPVLVNLTKMPMAFCATAQVMRSMDLQLIQTVLQLVQMKMAWLLSTLVSLRPSSLKQTRLIYPLI